MYRMLQPGMVKLECKSPMFVGSAVWGLLCIAVGVASAFSTTRTFPSAQTLATSFSTATVQIHPSSVREGIAAFSRRRRRRSCCGLNDSCSLLKLALIAWEGEISKEDAAMLEIIRGAAGNRKGQQQGQRKPKSILILSDATGVTAKSSVERSLTQFNGCDERFTRFIKLKTNDDDDDGGGGDTSSDGEDEEDCENITTQSFLFLKSDNQIASILKRAASSDMDVVVVYTLADPALRESTRRMCELSGLFHVDLLGPMLDCLETFFGRPPLGSPAMIAKDPPRRKALSDDYYRRIEAVEYTLQCDDGRNPHRLGEADVILLGVSRTGKTPLSVVLAQTMGLKVANVPLVVDLPPPKQLLDRRSLDRRRVFCLTLDPDDLQRIRKTRIQRELSATTSRNSKKSNYADRRYLLRDIQNAQSLALEHGFTEIDVTGRAVEETASWISSVLNERFGDHNVRRGLESE